MKNITTLALVLLCGFASAATVNWSVDRKSFSTSDGSSERAGDYLVQVFLFDNYTDVMNIITSWTTVPVPTTASSALDTYVQSSGKTGSTGAVTGTFDTTEPSGTTFSLFTIAWDGKTIAEASNFLVSTKVDSDAYIAPDNPKNVGKFTSASYANSSWTPIGVPEPSTAALALAGLALLIKRRRA